MLALLGTMKPWQRRTINLGLFAVFVIVVMLRAYQMLQGLEHRVFLMREDDYRETQKAQLALTLVSFHSYYHEWPCPPGQITDDALCELLGCQEAKLNGQHIDFFEKNGTDANTLDRNGHPLYFRTDDIIGTCQVYEGRSN